jgi:Zn finger protein HypA/HybF involved in hydrogenase expression
VFSPAALQQAYEMLTAGTPLAGSSLEVEGLPDRRQCSRCGDAFTVSAEDVAGHLVICPRCGEPSLLEVGTGLEVLSITTTEGPSPAV